MTIPVFGVLRRSALGWRDEHLAAGTAATEASEALALRRVAGAAPGALRAGRRSTLQGRGIRVRCRVLVQGGEWSDLADRPGRERLLDMGLDNRLVGDPDGTRIERRYTHLERLTVEDPACWQWVTHGAWPGSVWSSPGASSRVTMAMTAAGRLQGGRRRSGPRLRVDGRGGQSRLNRGSPMLNAQRPTTPQQEPGMAGAEEPPFMGPADPTPASGAGQRFSIDRIVSTSADPNRQRARARRCELERARSG